MVLPEIPQKSRRFLMIPSMPDEVHSALLWSIWARWDELQAQKNYVPNEPTRENLKKASQWLYAAGILHFDPLKDK